ncbi:MAG: hypothetical protein AAGC88_07560, partial [Bacteroidota bacterium]
MKKNRWDRLPSMWILVIGLLPWSCDNVQDSRFEKGTFDAQIGEGSAEESLVVNGVRYDGYEKYAYIQEAFKRGQINIEDTPRFPLYAPVHARRELAKAQRDRANIRTRSTATFTERGPSNIPGRTRAIIVDAGDESENTWYAGAVGGGVWQT